MLFYYGIDGKYVEITNFVMNNSIVNEFIVIPLDDVNRASIYGDHLPNILKHIKISTDNSSFILSHNEHCVINTKTNEIKINNDEYYWDNVGKILKKQVLDEYIYYEFLDSYGHDICKLDNNSIYFWENIKQTKNCVAFNTNGYVKHKVSTLNKIYSGKLNGIYIHRDYPLKIESDFHLLHKKYELSEDFSDILNDLLCSYRLSTKTVIHVNPKCEKELFVWKDYFINAKEIISIYDLNVSNFNFSNLIIILNYDQLFDLYLDKILLMKPDVFIIYNFLMKDHNFGNEIIDQFDIIENVPSKLTYFKRKQNIVYVKGIAGLANNMFQIAVAIHYAEKHNFKILLDNNNVWIQYGTSNGFRRDVRRKKDGKWIESYFDNILSKFDTIDFDKMVKNSVPIVTVSSGYECRGITNFQDPTHLLISGYSQNINLFSDVLPSLEKYFDFDDVSIKNYISNKYPINNENELHLCVGIRIGDDFKNHRPKIIPKSYQNAFTYFINHHKEEIKNKKINIYVLSDVRNGWQKMISSFQEIYQNIEIHLVSEDDITQFYLGLECNIFILSESTYHYYIALLSYIRDPHNKKVIAFYDTDITNYPLAFYDWIKVSHN